MSVDLDRALKDWTYRESVVGISDPVVELLTRAGAYAEANEEARDIWSPYGEDLGKEMITIRAAIPLDPTLPFDAIRAFVATAFGRYVVARHPSTPPATLNELAADEEERVQKAVLQNRNVGVAELTRLALSKFDRIRMDVANHPLLPRQLLEQLLAKDPHTSVRHYALKRLDLDGAALSQLLERDPRLGSSIAENANTAPETLVALAASDSFYTQQAVAKNPRSPAEALERLVNQKLADEIRKLVMLHPNTPQQWLIDTLISGSHRDKQTIISRPDLSPDAQMIAATNSSFLLRDELARRATDPRALAQLASDSASFVRKEVVNNPKTPPEVLRALRDDPDAEISKKARERLGEA